MSKSAKGTEISRRKALGLLGLGVAGLSYMAPTATVLGQTPPTDKMSDKEKGKGKSKSKSKGKSKGKSKDSKDTMGKDKGVGKS
jgi:hypothetical protein